MTEIGRDRPAAAVKKPSISVTAFTLAPVSLLRVGGLGEVLNNQNGNDKRLINSADGLPLKRKNTETVGGKGTIFNIIYRSTTEYSYLLRVLMNCSQS